MNKEVNISNTDNNSSASAVESESRALKNERRLIEIRRARVSELWSQGFSQPSIAVELHVSQPTINSDCAFLRQQAREQIKNFIVDRLPVTVAKAFVTLDLITQKLWTTVAQAERDRDEKTKMAALSAIQSAEMQKIEIVSNTGIVDQVITVAEQRQQVHSSIQNRQMSESEEEAEENTSDNNYSREQSQPAEEPAPTTKVRAIPVDDSGDRE